MPQTVIMLRRCCQSTLSILISHASALVSEKQKHGVMPVVLLNRQIAVREFMLNRPNSKFACVSGLCLSLGPIGVNKFVICELFEKVL